MAYLKDFCDRIHRGDYPEFLKLWEEYCYGDQPDGEEMTAVLEAVKASSLAKSFGVHVDRILSLWEKLQDPEERHKVLRLVIDLQSTNSDHLADLATEHLKSRYPQDSLLSEKLRLVGLRTREKFQGAIRNFELLSHMNKGNFVFHTSGWGTGEVIDLSLVREEASLEFEYVIGLQHLSFEKAFKTLIPLPQDHFYAQRFGDPDALEKEAKDKPNEILKVLLRDLGPKTAADIKEELCDLVIPAKEWNRWWQTARAKAKKDTKIESPKELKEPFRLREEAIPHEVAFHKTLESNPGVVAAIQMVYSFLRDFPETLKNQEFKGSLQTRLQKHLEEESLDASIQIQLLFLLDDLGEKEAMQTLEKIFSELTTPLEVISNMQVVTLQKKALQLFKNQQKEWTSLYLEFLFTTEHNLLRDFLIQELLPEQFTEELTKKLDSLLLHPLSFPEVLIWYFQKILNDKSKLPFSDSKGKNRFFEALLILLDHLEEKPQSRDLAKKILSLITANRYKIVRDIMQHSSLEEVKEYLLLATKCSSLTDHDIKILQSLGEVVHPSLARMRKEKSAPEEEVIWTTQEGYQKVHARMQQIATVETVQNAKEIEAARAHGDLRENAEFKAALERRDRLQSELKFLSNQISLARILTAQDISTEEVGVGTIVHCKDSRGEHQTFTLLGPWDADPDRKILSFQSKLAQAMKGKRIGQTFEFQGEEFTILEINNYFDQNR